MQLLAELSPQSRELALARFRMLEPHLREDRPLRPLALAAGIPFRTAQRWVSLYQRDGLAGLVRKSRRDRAEKTCCASAEAPRVRIKRSQRVGPASSRHLSTADSLSSAMPAGNNRYIGLALRRTGIGNALSDLYYSRAEVNQRITPFVVNAPGRIDIEVRSAHETLRAISAHPIRAEAREMLDCMRLRDDT